MGRQFCICTTALCCFLICSGTVCADYILQPLVNGQTSVTVQPGDSFVLDLDLSSTVSDSHYAGIFTVEFSKPGLSYLDHTWSTPYVTSSADNRSVPTISECPIVLTESSYVAGSSDPGTVDVYFENFLNSGEFGVGKIVSMNLDVPSGFPLGDVSVRAIPIGFDKGFDIPSTGGMFTLHVVPEPGIFVLLLGAVFSAIPIMWHQKCRYYRGV
jgi:hypothetical protein